MNSVDLPPLEKQRRMYLPKSSSLENVIEHLCVQVTVLPKLAADSVENKKEAWAG